MERKELFESWQELTKELSICYSYSCVDGVLFGENRTSGECSRIELAKRKDGFPRFEATGQVPGYSFVDYATHEFNSYRKIKEIELKNIDQEFEEFITILHENIGRESL